MQLRQGAADHLYTFLGVLNALQSGLHGAKAGFSAVENVFCQNVPAYLDALLAEKSPPKPRANVGAFLNNLTQSLAKIQSCGIGAVSERRETEDKIVVTITIPK